MLQKEKEKKSEKRRNKIDVGISATEKGASLKCRECIEMSTDEDPDTIKRCIYCSSCEVKSPHRM